MSSGDDTGFSRFINSKDNGNVRLSNPVQWGKLGSSIIAAVITTITAGFIDIFTALGNAADSVLGGIESFFVGWERPELADTGVGVGRTGDTVAVDGLIGATIGQFVDAYSTVFVVNADQFGLLALPVNVGIALAVAYVIGVGGRAIIDRATGGL